VAHAGHRLKEAAKLGFRRAIGPAGAPEDKDQTIDLAAIERIDSLVAGIASGEERGKKGARPSRA
jgi:predicted ATP-dependent serine protease